MKDSEVRFYLMQILSDERERNYKGGSLMEGKLLQTIAQNRELALLNAIDRFTTDDKPAPSEVVDHLEDDEDFAILLREEKEMIAKWIREMEETK